MVVYDAATVQAWRDSARRAGHPVRYRRHVGSVKQHRWWCQNAVVAAAQSPSHGVGVVVRVEDRQRHDS